MKTKSPQDFSNLSMASLNRELVYLLIIFNHNIKSSFVLVLENFILLLIIDFFIITVDKPTSQEVTKSLK